jgi:hypothetical protein
MEWQPIETAPVLYQWYLVWDASHPCGNKTRLAFADSTADGGTEICWLDIQDSDFELNVTHWMPLPAPPEGI